MKTNLIISVPSTQKKDQHCSQNITTLRDLFRLVSWAKTQCSQECMVNNCGKLISEENYTTIKKTIQENTAV